MFLANVSSTSWTAIIIIAILTLLAEFLVIKYLLPWFEKKSDRIEEKRRIESRKRARRIRIDSERAKVDFNNLVNGAGQGGSDEG